MKFIIPKPRQQVHQALHDELRRATEAGGEVGAAAKSLVQHARIEEEVMYPAALLVGRHVRIAMCQGANHRVAS